MKYLLIAFLLIQSCYLLTTTKNLSKSKTKGTHFFEQIFVPLSQLTIEHIENQKFCFGSYGAEDDCYVVDTSVEGWNKSSDGKGFEGSKIFIVTKFTGHLYENIPKA